MQRNIIAILAAASLGLPAAVSAGEGVPLGHPDFYPSTERPIGWRGDGTGAWPGAAAVDTWDADATRNIVWKTGTPRAGLCQPVVAGEKVFITADNGCEGGARQRRETADDPTSPGLPSSPRSRAGITWAVFVVQASRLLPRTPAAAGTTN